MTIKLDLQQNSTQEELFDMGKISRDVLVDCMNEIGAEMEEAKLLLQEANNAAMLYMGRLKKLRAQLADLYTLV
jgi:hypothetical protein